MTHLEPMDDAAFETWRDGSIRDYAAEKVQAGAWPADEAAARAAREFGELLPDGRRTAGHSLLSILADTGEPVGRVWFAEEERPFGRVVFIYDIAIDPAHRRQGHAQSALADVEAYARAHGCVGVQLHVFGGNDGARALYRRAGYLETDVTMLKRVGGPAGPVRRETP